MTNTQSKRPPHPFTTYTQTAPIGTLRSEFEFSRYGDCCQFVVYKLNERRSWAPVYSSVWYPKAWRTTVAMQALEEKLAELRGA